MRSADVAFVHVAHADGADDECGDGLYAELLHDVAAVGDDGREPDLQPVGDLFVQQTLSDERQHFRFAYGEQVGGRSAVLPGKGMVGSGRFAAQAQQIVYQSFFAAEDIDLAHSGELGRIPFAQQDRLVTVFQEEGAVAHENLHGGEIVEITLRSGCDEFGEAVEHGDLSRRTYLFENRPQAQPDQDVGRNDGDGRFCRGTAHSWW